MGCQQPACLTTKLPLGLRTQGAPGASGVALCDVVLGVSGVPGLAQVQMLLFEHRTGLCSLLRLEQLHVPFVFSQVPSNLHYAPDHQTNVYHESSWLPRSTRLPRPCLFRAFIKVGLGAWVEKPTEQDQFALTP